MTAVSKKIRVFVASPSDVSEERRLIEKRLNVRNGRQDTFYFQAVGYDFNNVLFSPYQSFQRSIIDQIGSPSECHLVIVLLWSRLGSICELKDLPPSWRRPDRSVTGTEIEILEALQHADTTGTMVLFYRRASTRPDGDEAQRKLVNDFFSSELFSGPTGRPFYSYETIDEFETMFEVHLDRALKQLFPDLEPRPKRHRVWHYPPYPGLRAFESREGKIFFGRRLETDALIDRLKSGERFLAIVGESGIGKSSLVEAGLIFKLAENALPGSRNWKIVRPTHLTLWDREDGPIRRLALTLNAQFERWPDPRVLEVQLERASKEDIENIIETVLGSESRQSEILLFLDQFEEFLGLPKPNPEFIGLLAAAAQTERIRIVIAVRKDAYHRALSRPGLTDLLQKGRFELAAPNVAALIDMIKKPAELIGSEVEDELTNRILKDAQANSAALPLVAFILAKLYDDRDAEDRLTVKAYERLGGLERAVGRHADDVFTKLDKEVQENLSNVFSKLVETRHRYEELKKVSTRLAKHRDLATTPPSRVLIRALREGGLLTIGNDSQVVQSLSTDPEATVRIAHDAVLTNWERLKKWVDEAYDHLHVRDQLSYEAAFWFRHEKEKKYLWPDERMKEVKEMLDYLGHELSAEEAEFVGSVDAKAMENELKNPETGHARRRAIGIRLDALKDERRGVGLDPQSLPDIEWYRVPRGTITRPGFKTTSNGTVTLDGTVTEEIEEFYIAKYPVTWAQYRSFLDAEDGYAVRKAEFGDVPGEQHRKRLNHPAEVVSWYEAVAFCQWLASKRKIDIRLPIEWEWQLAATGGDERTYPWGPNWDWRTEFNRANTYGSGINETTAVGMYPDGHSPCGALDMVGNVWEWCLNQNLPPFSIQTPSRNSKMTVKGGSWFYNASGANCSERSNTDFPMNRNVNMGFRVCYR